MVYVRDHSLFKLDGAETDSRRNAASTLRGVGIALFGAVGGILGAASGPILIAAAAQHVFGSESAIGLGMASVVGVCCPLAAICLALGFRAMRDAMVDAESWDRS